MECLEHFVTLVLPLLGTAAVMTTYQPVPQPVYPVQEHTTTVREGNGGGREGKGGREREGG